MAGVERVTLVDRDIYEQGNLVGQNITPREVGRPKARVQARALHLINPGLRVDPVHDAVENVPAGRLRADVILGCLDSREARRYVSELAWHLGVPYVDAGIQGDGLLARVNVYLPGPDSPCLQCGWDERDYELLEQSYPCLGKEGESPATNSPSSLGALAASLQIIACEAILSGRWDNVAAGKQVLIDATYHRHYLTMFRRNPECRFDHAIWGTEELERGPDHITIGEALVLGSSNPDGDAAAIGAHGKAFVRRLTCPSCGLGKELLRLRHRLTKGQLACRECGGQMVATGFDMCDRLARDQLSARTLRRPLKSLGFRRCDVFSVATPTGEKHYELNGEAD